MMGKSLLGWGEGGGVFSGWGDGWGWDEGGVGVEGAWGRKTWMR